MKTTLDLPADLLRAVKIRAAQENRRLKDLVADLLQRGLAEDSRAEGGPRRVKLPLIECPHEARPEDLSPERVAAILLEEETEAALAAMRR